MMIFILVISPAVWNNCKANLSYLMKWTSVNENIGAFENQDIQWPTQSGPRSKSHETFYLYDPRAQSLARQGHQQFDQAPHGFDISCDNFDKNITAVSLFTLELPDTEVLKKITLTFCDGSEKSVSTQVNKGEMARKFNNFLNRLDTIVANTTSCSPLLLI